MIRTTRGVSTVSNAARSSMPDAEKKIEKS